MRVLLVEDELAVARQLQEILEAECQADVEVARSRDSALRVLERGEDLDLIVCDLKIPTQDASLDVAEDHGLRVYDAARDMHPGTFCRFFSGYARLENVGDRLASGPSIEVFGPGQTWAIVDSFPKSKQPEFIDWVKELGQALGRLDHIEIDQSALSFMSDYEVRTLRIYASRLAGSQIRASLLGGLSSSKVLKVEILDERSTHVGAVVAKVDKIPLVKEDYDRYSRFVAPVMSVGTFAPLASTVLHGCGQTGAAFYSLASNGYSDLFSLAAFDDNTARLAIKQLQDSHQQWRGAEVSESKSVATLRTANISDDEFHPWIDELGADRVASVEAPIMSVHYSIQHGDLHGHNVLVDAEGRPVTIDYGTVGQHPVALDPVTLELSFLFHFEGPDLGGWPTIEQASCWFDLTQFAEGSPLDGVIGVCRRWALSVATRQQLAAVVYAHATRQLKYDDTSKPLALAIARAAMAVLADE